MGNNNYYTEEYREFHKNLSKDGKSSLSKAQKMYDKVKREFSDFKNIVSGTSEWEGEMATLFKQQYFSYVSDCYDKMTENIINSLEPGYEKLDELVILFDDLKATSERYSELLIQYAIEKSKNVPPFIRVRNDDNKATSVSVVNPEYITWVNRLNDLAMQIDDLRVQLDELKAAVFDTLSQIDKFDDNVIDLFYFIECINLTIGVDTPFYDVPVLCEKNPENDNLYMYSYNGENYSIICDGYFLDLYESFLQKNKYYQSRGKWYSKRCNDAAIVFSQNLNNELINHRWISSSENTSGLYNVFEQEAYDPNADGLLAIKTTVYNELLQGRSCALQVGNGESSGNRHWVTVIGLSDNVHGPEDLIPENILILDNWDGRVQTLAENGRDFLAWGSVKGKECYQVRKASISQIADIEFRRSKLRRVAVK